ncbi:MULTISPECIES: ABC transporter ATP-binding protein [Anaeromyxobacter]|uniref:ABC transporter ATP-binding protein n=1 Tax=Anaeromyxobacter TaxID=161492 RepID=UPI001F57D67E|nr:MULTISPECIES: nitrate/sulfonate/bicarbonate ABC transporter ATP-binding protein [unclassified Anaeromyxobacter]
MAANAANGPLCELRRLVVEFPQPHGPPRRVLEDVDLEVRAGEVLALLGPSGCGKSTILRVLAGLLAPTGGEVRFRGAPLRGVNPAVGFMFQGAALFPWMTVARNVSEVLRAAGTPPAEVPARTERALRLVGLAEVADAYPRELSGGMKQRVGTARALSLEPELLFMDEPFSQVDALTAEALRAEILDIWAAAERRPSAIVLVSHDIPEVVYMADRIVVLDANPGRVRAVIDDPLPRPRDYRSPGLAQLVDRLHDVITGMEMPDVPAGGAPVEALPDASAGDVIGLVEYLDARGGREDVFRIAAETDSRFDRTINAVNAAELLDLVDTPRRAVVLAPLGQRFVRAPDAERRAIWRERLLGLGLFRQVQDAIARSPGGRVERDFVLELIAVAAPREDFEAVFERFVSWASYGGLFVHDAAAQVLTAP